MPRFTTDVQPVRLSHPDLPAVDDDPRVITQYGGKTLILMFELEGIAIPGDPPKVQAERKNALRGIYRAALGMRRRNICFARRTNQRCFFGSVHSEYSKGTGPPVLQSGESYQSAESISCFTPSIVFRQRLMHVECPLFEFFRICLHVVWMSG